MFDGREYIPPNSLTNLWDGPAPPRFGIIEFDPETERKLDLYLLHQQDEKFQNDMDTALRRALTLYE
jgi:hypothetical protein